MAQGHEQTSERLGASQNQLSSTDSPHHSQCPATCTRQCMAAHARKFSASADLYKNSNVVLWLLLLLLLLFIRHLVTFIQGLNFHACDDGWVEIQTKRTIRAENEVEANKLVNNYRVRREKCFCASVKGSVLCRCHLDKHPTFASYAYDTFLEMCTSTHSF